MAKKPKAPVVVAGLGRPETAAETAARKAVDSHNYRARKTVNNLVLSLIVSLGLVLVIFLMVPRGTGGFAEQSVDVATLAADASPSAGRTLAAPKVPEGWKAKQAVLRQSDDITSWQINYTTADNAYAAVVQAFTADGSPVDEAWIAQQLEQQQPTGSEQLGNLDWVVYDHSDRSPDKANMLFGLASDTGDGTVLVYGTDTAGTLRVLATEVAASISDDSSTRNTPSEETP